MTVPDARCRHCDAEFAERELGLLRLEDDAIEVQVQHRGLVVCPDCNRVLGGISDYDRTDLEQMDAETWERIRAYEDI